MSLKEKLEICKSLAELLYMDALRTKGHIIGYGAELTGLLSLINAEEGKHYVIGAVLYVAGRACNNARQQLKVNEKIGNHSYSLTIKSINDILERKGE